MAKIHHSSVVEPTAQIADDVEIGPLCYVGPDVVIGSGCRLVAQVNIDGHTTIGKNNIFFPFAAIGQRPQDHSAKDETLSYVKIGDHNEFREGCTVHRGTVENSVTEIGNYCLFMNGSHVAHNCKIGNHVLIVGMSGCAGHCVMMDYSIISGVSGMHQFCRIGRFAMISGGSVFSKDIPPFMIAEGRNGGIKMINLVGLQRAGFTEERIRIIKSIYKIYYRQGLTPKNALKQIAETYPNEPEAKEFLDFCAGTIKGVLANKLEGHRL